MDDREFERERKLTGMYRDALDAFREDARQIVREEVAAARPGPGELEELVRRTVEEEMESRRGTDSGGLPWSAAGLAAAIVIAALGAVWGVTLVAGPGGVRPGSPGDSDGAGEVVGAGVDAAETTAPALPGFPPAAPSLAGPAARFASFFASRDRRLGGVLATAPPSIRAAALDSWAADGAVEAAYDFLVQLALRGLADSTLEIDGAILRSPCRGQTCGTLIEHWRAHRGDARYPPLGPDPAADAAALAQVERILILRHAGIVE